MKKKIGDWNMNWIKHFMKKFRLRRSYDKNFSDLHKSHRTDVIERFNLTQPINSYWIDCTHDYPNAPEEINEQIEFESSLDEQSDFVLRHWRFFPETTRQDFKHLIQYVLYLRQQLDERKDGYESFDGEVRDNIYEM